jgi:hypothetical protein
VTLHAAQTVAELAEPYFGFLLFEILHEAGDVRARRYLRAVYALLQDRAERLHDAELRRSFLEQSRLGREITAACQTYLAEG